MAINQRQESLRYQIYQLFAGIVLWIAGVSLAWYWASTLAGSSGLAACVPCLGLIVAIWIWSFSLIWVATVLGLGLCVGMSILLAGPAGIWALAFAWVCSISGGACIGRGLDKSL